MRRTRRRDSTGSSTDGPIATVYFARMCACNCIVFAAPHYPTTENMPAVQQTVLARSMCPMPSGKDFDAAADAGIAAASSFF